MRWTPLMRGGPVAVSLVLAGSVAAASDPEPQPEAPDVALLAGIRTSAPIASVGGLAGPSGPGAVATLEMRATGRMWWMLRGGAGYFSQSYRGAWGETSWHGVDVQAATGLRYVANPGDIIEVSPHLMVGGGYGTLGFEGGASRRWTAAASAGLNLDVAVAPGFGMRMSSGLLSAGYTYASNDSDGQQEANHGFDLSVALSPSLEARFTF